MAGNKIEKAGKRPAVSTIQRRIAKRRELSRKLQKMSWTSSSTKAPTPKPRKPGWESLLEMLNITPARDSLLQYLGPQDLSRLCQTSSAVRNAVRSNIWDLNSQLLRFVEDPKAFRSMLGKCDALIFDQFAFEFLSTTHLPHDSMLGHEGKSMRIMLPKENFVYMEMYLNKEGYSYCRSFHDELAGCY
ncbi:hypothetical protein GGR56DRAFT_672542 [Xylariaceae sp. FL0804]|nr:hypothetical protein GGR56DRAFT_672542 [Xylariaceae sp. FL0804]